MSSDGANIAAAILAGLGNLPVEVTPGKQVAPRQKFLEAAMPPIAIAFNTAQARARIDELLVETQQQAEELQAQSEELRVANEELQTQTENLQRSEQDLRGKQVELEQANVELEEKAAVGAAESLLLPPEAGLLHWPALELDAASAQRFSNGNPVCAEISGTGPARVYGPAGKLLGLGELDAAKLLKPKRIFNL